MANERFGSSGDARKKKAPLATDVVPVHGDSVSFRVPEVTDSTFSPASKILVEQARRKIPDRFADYFKVVNGERRFDLENEKVRAVVEYGERALNGKLRVRAEERNAHFPNLLELGKMSLPEMVDELKKPENRVLYLRNAKGKAKREFLPPNDYATTTAKKTTNEALESAEEKDQWGEALFPHDSRLIVKGILASKIPDKIEYAKGIVKSIVYEIYLLGYSANGTSLDLVTRSHIANLMDTAWDVFDAMQAETPETDRAKRKENEDWLRAVKDAAEYQFNEYWNNNNHHVPGSLLVTPGDTDVNYNDLSACEDTEDMNWEAMGRDHDFVKPRFISAYINEMKLFRKFEEEFGEEGNVQYWDEKIESTTKEVQRLWDGKSFRALDIRKTGKLSSVLGLGQYMTMYTGIAEQDQADSMVPQLSRFEMPYGYTNIDINDVPDRPTEEMLAPFPELMRPTIMDLWRTKQWGDWGEEEEQQQPNDFPIKAQELIGGLIHPKYENKFIDEAIRVAEKELFAYAEFYDKKVEEAKAEKGEDDKDVEGTLPEKINALTGEIGKGGYYEPQFGFGWTIGLVLWLNQVLPKLYEIRDKFRMEQITQQEEPVQIFVASTNSN